MKITLNSNRIGICILCYNRLTHIKKTLNAVKKYINKKDKIYIFLDNYSKRDPKKNIILCKKVQRYLYSLKNNKIIIIKSKKNIGPKNNWFRAYNFMFKIYDKVICLEDDIVIKKGFINFVSYYLNKFENNPKVMSITGYATPINLPINYHYDCYFSNRSMSWSKATWKRVWKKYTKLHHNHLSILKNKNKLKLLSSSGEDLIPTLVLDYLGKVNSFQIWWIWNIIINSGLCINPVKNLINNIGFDGTGLHITKKNKFKFNKSNLNNQKRMNQIIFDKKINDSFLKNFKISKKNYYIFKNFHPSLIRLFLNFKTLFKKR